VNRTAMRLFSYQQGPTVEAFGTKERTSAKEATVRILQAKIDEPEEVRTILCADRASKGKVQHSGRSF